MSLRVEEYVRADGSIPYRPWFESLEPQAAAKVAVAKVRLSIGNTSRVKWFEGIGECVIDWGPGYRLYLARDGDELLILYAAAPSAASRRQSPARRHCTRSTRHARPPRGDRIRCGARGRIERRGDACH